MLPNNTIYINNWYQYKNIKIHQFGIEKYQVNQRELNQNQHHQMVQNIIKEI